MKLQGNSTVTGATTAMQRKGASAPLRWLLAHRRHLMVSAQRALDYGCGRGADVAHLASLPMDVVGFDPHWRPIPLNGQFELVLCTFVLNVVNEEIQAEILAEIERRLTAGGRAFLSVRRDLPQEGAPGRGCWQRYVQCPAGYETVYEGSDFAIFMRTKQENSHDIA